MEILISAQPFVIFYKLFFVFENGILLLVAFEANENNA